LSVYTEEQPNILLTRFFRVYVFHMNRFFRLAMGCICIALATTPASAGSSDPIADELKQLNATLQLATKNYDVATLRNQITDNYVLVSSSGRVYDRAAFLADAADRSYAYDINEAEDVSVRHYNDDSAIVMAILHVRYRNAGKTRDVRIRYADFWVKLNGTWRLAHGEASPMKRPV
jgi:ketosteroid isomerase-like protein